MTSKTRFIYFFPKLFWHCQVFKYSKMHYLSFKSYRVTHQLSSLPLVNMNAQAYSLKKSMYYDRVKCQVSVSQSSLSHWHVNNKITSGLFVQAG